MEPSPGPLAEALGRIGDRWTLLVVDALLAGPSRFGELQHQIPGIAPNILSERLKRLERHGLVVARPYSTKPLRLSYELTGTGRDLAGAVHLLAAWASETTGAEGRRHDTCGTPLEVRWYCPTCAQIDHEQARSHTEDDAELRFL